MENPTEENPLKSGLEQIALLYRAQPTPANRQLLRTALRSYSEQLKTGEADIPGDILEALGAEDRRATVLAFCSLVAAAVLTQKPKPAPAPQKIYVPSYPPPRRDR